MDVAAGGRGDEDWPLVSAVVPTVDRPVPLQRAVQSILHQDYPGPIEIVIVFDGTPPRVPDLRVPPNRSVRAIANVRTKGLPGNRNTGYLAAEGQYLSSCDDDDEWHPKKISAQMQRLAERPEAVLCATGISVQREDRMFYRRGTDTEITFDDLLRSRHIEVCPTSSLFPRRLIDEGLLVDENITGGYAEDYEWLLRVARLGPIVCVPEPLTTLHWHDDSFFVGNWWKVESGLTYLLGVVPEFAGHASGLARIEGQLAFAHAALGHRRQALALAVRSLRRSTRIRQTYAAILVAVGVVSADRVAATARRFGRGI